MPTTHNEKAYLAQGLWAVSQKPRPRVSPCRLDVCARVPSSTCTLGKKTTQSLVKPARVFSLHVSAVFPSCGRPQGGNDEQKKGGRRGRWILKPSTLNKGAALALGDDFETLKDAIHESPDIREWVLQVRNSKYTMRLFRHFFTHACVEC